MAAAEQSAHVHAESAGGHDGAIRDDLTLAALSSRNLNLLETARLFAVLNVALADAQIANWDTKIFFNFWRPVTAIRLADTDGNAAEAIESRIYGGIHFRTGCSDGILQGASPSEYGLATVALR